MCGLCRPGSEPTLTLLANTSAQPRDEIHARSAQPHFRYYHSIGPSSCADSCTLEVHGCHCDPGTREPLAVTFDGPTTLVEGSTATLGYRASRPDEVTMEDWDLDGDGNFATPAATIVLDAAQRDGPSSFPIRVRVVTVDAVTTIAIVIITVTNVPPTVSAVTSGGTPTAGQVITYQAHLSDLGVNDTFITQWAWGAGTTSVGEVVRDAQGWLTRSTHAYAPGSYTIGVAVTDDDGATGTAQGAVTVTGTLAAVSPVLECVAAQPDGTFVAWFGYRNPNASPVTLAVGTTNRFTPTPANRGQPTVFQPGRQVRVFTVAFPGTNLVGHLGCTSPLWANSVRLVVLKTRSAKEQL